MAITVSNLLKVNARNSSAFTKTNVRRSSSTSNSLVVTTAFDVEASKGTGTSDFFTVHDIRVPYLSNLDGVTLEVPAPIVPLAVETLGEERSQYAVIKASPGIDPMIAPSFSLFEQTVFVSLRKGGTDVIKIQPQCFLSNLEFENFLRSPEYAANYAPGDTLFLFVPKYLGAVATDIFCYQTIKRIKLSVGEA